MKKRVQILLFLSLVLAGAAQAQGYMATKTMLDSLKVGKFHGTAALGAKVEQTDNLKIEINAALECMVPFQRHKLRFAGNYSYNVINMIDNGNKGYFYVAGDFYQFSIKEKSRYKTPVFFSAIGGYQFDYCRNLHDRLFFGAMATFQPLREHEHLCLEPSVGMIMDFKYWNIFGAPSQQSLRDFYNGLTNPVVKQYLDVDPAGMKWEYDPLLSVGVNFMGEWDKVAFNLFALLAQPVIKQFERHDVTEDYLLAYYPQFYHLYNSNYLPMVTVDAQLSIELTQKFRLLLKGDFLWDGGQLPRGGDSPSKIYSVPDPNDSSKQIPLGARCMRYCWTLGFAVTW